MYSTLYLFNSLHFGLCSAISYSLACAIFLIELLHILCAKYVEITLTFVSTTNLALELLVSDPANHTAISYAKTISFGIDAIFEVSLHTL